MIMVKSEMGREGEVLAAANRRSRAPSAHLKKDVCICSTPRTIVGLKEFHYLEKHLASIFSPHAFPNPNLTSPIAKTLAFARSRDAARRWRSPSIFHLLHSQPRTGGWRQDALTEWHACICHISNFGVEWCSVAFSRSVIWGAKASVHGRLAVKTLLDER